MMKRNGKKRKKEQKTVTDPRDKKAERIIYALLILLMIAGITMGYLMSKGFAGMELQENGHYRKIEIEK